MGGFLGQLFAQSRNLHKELEDLTIPLYLLPCWFFAHFLTGSVFVTTFFFQEVDTCIGCMQKESDVKLQKHCDSEGERECVQCYCRPMWCLECMGKWFASRQDQQRPETWLSCKSPCPTCRAVFCILDVCKIQSWQRFIINWRWQLQDYKLYPLV